jgi:colanic acid biosynthesis glycosyl transferase WcaI
MRVLYLSQYFPPEVGATQTRAYEMATGLIRAGHEVTMLTEVPNHPTGIIHPGYRGHFWLREEMEGIDVVRVWVKTSPVKTMHTRLAFYLSYMINATLAGLMLTRGYYDVIYATSPPLFVGGAALALSISRGIPLVFEVRDLWPESAIALGELKNPQAIALAERLERTCYRRARRIVLTAREMKDHLVKQGIPAAKMQLIRNGANPELFRFDPEARRRIREKLDLGARFVVVYAGLIGIAQALSTALDSAKSLQTLGPDVHMVFVGDGPVKDDLLAQAMQLQLTNVTFLPSQPRDQIPAYLSAADIALVPLVRQQLIGALPSKMFDAMACERSVILAAAGESCQVLREADAGMVIPPEDPSSLTDAILSLRADPHLCRRYGQNGRRAVLAHYSRQAQAQRLAELLEELGV